MEQQTAPPAPDEGVDRKQLQQLLRRFRGISAARLQRVRGMLDPRHRQFIDLLPLLLHVNNPSLPGYVSQQTPCGISDYTPTAAELALAKRLYRSFSPNRQAPEAARVYGVYLIGSSGTIGHSDGSDLDVWICYPEELEAGSLELLQRKAILLQQWAGGIGLESHLFLMNDEKFKRGQREPLTGENCGSAQHYLLLDEFYRTGILLAGRLPAWWLVPPAAEANYAVYCQRLVQNRYVRGAKLVDFGGIAGVPAGEFVGAGIWQLYKAIDSPYKSVLKLLLFEVYAANFPGTECLSADYKRTVCRGITDIDELDPYVMIYRRLERHLLEREQPERLEIVRRCLYYKAGKALSRRIRNGEEPSWQHLLMQRLTTEWDWDKAKLAMLDSRSTWKVDHVESERNELVKELTYSYRFLSEFARQSGAERSIDAIELSILGRKLYAAYERKAGKIDMVNPGRAIDVAESELSIRALPAAAIAGSARLWGAYKGVGAARGEPASRPLKQSACLTELLCWCVANGVIGERTHIAVRERIDGLRLAEVNGMVRELRDHVLAGATAGGPADEAFEHTARAVTMLAFVNVAADPLREAREQDRQRISSRTDSLGFSAMRENLVINLETVVRNSWGELISTRYVGAEGLIRCLRDFLQLGSADAASRPRLAIRCFGASRADAIAARVTELFGDIERCIYRANAGTNLRYVLEIQNRMHVVQHRRGVTSAASADNLPGLYDILGAAQPEWSALTIDRYALERSPLPAICRHISAWRCSVFSEPVQEAIRVTIVDENGSFTHTEYPGAREAPLLGAIDKFLESVRFRRNSAVLPAADSAANGEAPRYFRIGREAGGDYRARELPAPSTLRTGAFLNIQAIAEQSEGDQVLFTVYCDGVAFSQGELGDAFQPLLAAHIKSLRRAAESYPAYITDLDLSALAAGAPLQTVHFLQHKRRLEAGINRALGIAAG